MKANNERTSRDKVIQNKAAEKEILHGYCGFKLSFWVILT